MREFLVAYSEYEQQMRTTTQDDGDLVLARRRELVDSMQRWLGSNGTAYGRALLVMCETLLGFACTVRKPKRGR